MMRAVVSAPPAGGYGTMTRTGRFGHVACARAFPTNGAAAIAANTVRRVRAVPGMARSVGWDGNLALIEAEKDRYDSFASLPLSLPLPFSTRRPNFRLVRKRSGLTLPASPRLPRQGASSLIDSLKLRPAESIQVKPSFALKVVMSDSPPSL